MVEKRKTAKGAAQKIGNPPKQISQGPVRQCKRLPKGLPQPQHLPYGSRSPPSLRPPTISKLQATAISSR